jgi:hypothetical protein
MSCVTNESVERMLQFKIFKMKIEKSQNILFLCLDYFTCFQEKFYYTRSYLKTRCRKLDASIESVSDLFTSCFKYLPF